jgi:hypothetical protein
MKLVKRVESFDQTVELKFFVCAIFFFKGFLTA